ncbi:MAG: ABC transporter permease [Kineosporiaceae bacterium]
MIWYVLRRVAASVLLVLVVSLLAFLLPRLGSVDAVAIMLGTQETPQSRAALEAELGLDRPWPVQYVSWLGGALRGDFGDAWTSGAPIGELVGQRLPVTLSIAVAGLLISCAVGIGAGVAAGVRAGGPVDHVVRAAAAVAISIPPFWLAMLLVALFAIQWPLFAATGWVSPADSVGGWARGLVLPGIAVALFGVAHLARLSRSSVLDVMNQEHVRMARVRGLSPARIVTRHVLRNAAPPVVASTGLVFIACFGASALVEVVFALPGLGQSLVDAASRGDVPVIQAIAVVSACLVAAVNLVGDLTQLGLDPRVRHA